METNSSISNSKKEWIKLLKGLPLLLVCIWLFDFALASGLGAMNSRILSGSGSGKINYYVTHRQNFPNAVIGSSRSHFHVDPKQLGEGWFNLSFSGMDLSYQYGLLQILEKKGSLPNRALLHIDKQFFVEENPTQDVSYLSIYYDQIPWIKRQLDQKSLFARGKFFLQSYRFNGQVLSILKNYLRPSQKFTNDLGFNSYQALEDDEKTIGYLLKRLPKLEQTDLVMGDEQRLLLNDILGLCSKNKIKVLGFTSPTAFPQDYPHGENSLKISQEIEGIFKKYDYNYVDLTQRDLKEELPPSMWHDLVHLNILGSEIIGTLLKKELDRQ